MIDLWPEDIGQIKIKSPIAILKEQAALLGRKTGALLEATAGQGDTPGEDFSYKFCITAPALGLYSHRLFTIEHGIELYPLNITIDDDICREIAPDAKDNLLRIESEEAFLEILRTIFASTKTRVLISGLLAQIDEEPNGADSPS